ncbi:MAG: hypothetical protein HY294_05255 [Candidatus Rokubacteria bacterium]|nr:hypothetical protein [Candidatus Rokubacteria bacterium]MBI3825385.1 hypothetical protein [Candidatus Rokubacteria bacterium]
MSRRAAGRRPRSALRAGLLVAAVLGTWPVVGGAHEERLLVGRVEAIEPVRKLLVLIDAKGGARRRLEVNAETEVMACRSSAGLGALQPGIMVRVKYLERAGAPSEVKSVLLLGSHR